MMIPLAQKITQLKRKYGDQNGLPAYADIELLEICEVLLSMVDQLRADIGVAFEAQVRTNQRLHALEKVAPEYREPRG